MFNKSIVKVVEKNAAISAKLESVTFNSIRKILPDHAILDACREEKYDYRSRLMTPIVIVLHMITAAIGPEESFNAAWQLAWSSFSASFSMDLRPITFPRECRQGSKTSAVGCLAKADTLGLSAGPAVFSEHGQMAWPSGCAG